MATINGCYREISQYNALSEDLMLLIKSLEKSGNCCELVKKQIDDKYNVNGDITPLSHKTSELKEDINETSNYLKNYVLPEIEKKVIELKRQINYLENQAKKKAEEKKKEIEKSVKKKEKQGR